MSCRRLFNYLATFTLMAFLSGCLHTYLDGPPIGPSYLRLAALGQSEVRVRINVPDDEITVGRQWVLLAIPAGIIKVSRPRQLLGSALFRILSERGYRPVIVDPQGTTAEEADINIEKFTLNCSVPDLFFVRIVRCDAAIEAKTSRAPRAVVSGQGEDSAYKTSGFKPQLESILGRALDKTTTDLVSNAGL